MEKKICTKCLIEKDINEFYKRESSKDGFRKECKKCLYIYCKKRLILKGDEYKEKIKLEERIKRKNNPSYYNSICKKYRDNNKDKRLNSCKKWNKNNPEKYKEIQKRARVKRRSTPQGNIYHRLSSGIRQSLKKGKEGRSWEKLVGYTCNQLKEHLEKQFKEGMSWDEFLKGKIHIDHIKPVVLFKYESYEDIQFKECWSLSNLQPLWAEDNLKKNDKYEDRN
jgi:hypothetical protein